MTDVVDSDELLRRIQRARACAVEEKHRWRDRRDTLGPTDPEASREAAVRVLTYETVLRVLDEILTPGRHPAERI
ncbi:3-deoxy-D-manno-octulosonic acid transferase [Streptomyces sp. NPDC004065]|uniref:3-deoxy-D-manno-octulosonic acid transferase n=1 Tax=Streptomyces sp. NPDC004065 TaxID=3364689 RepID=UPI00384A8E39